MSPHPPLHYGQVVQKWHGVPFKLVPRKNPGIRAPCVPQTRSSGELGGAPHVHDLSAWHWCESGPLRSKKTFSSLSLFPKTSPQYKDCVRIPSRIVVFQSPELSSPHSQRARSWHLPSHLSQTVVRIPLRSMANLERPLSVRSDVERASSPKDAAKHSEFQHRGGMSQNDADFLDNLPDSTKKKAVLKVDVRSLHRNNIQPLPPLTTRMVLSRSD